MWYKYYVKSECDPHTSDVICHSLSVFFYLVLSLPLCRIKQRVNFVLNFKLAGLGSYQQLTGCGKKVGLSLKLFGILPRDATQSLVMPG